MALVDYELFTKFKDRLLKSLTNHKEPLTESSQCPRHFICICLLNLYDDHIKVSIIIIFPHFTDEKWEPQRCQITFFKGIRIQIQVFWTF